jgi:hypothetical protein
VQVLQHVRSLQTHRPDLAEYNAVGIQKGRTLRRKSSKNCAKLYRYSNQCNLE